MDCLGGQTDQEMASSNTNQLNNIVISLTEDDIPGTKISRESLEHCKIYGGRVQPNNPCILCGHNSYSSSRPFCNWRILEHQAFLLPLDSPFVFGIM